MFRRQGTSHFEPGAKLTLENYAKGGAIMSRAQSPIQKQGKKPTKYFAKGGPVHDDEAQDKKLFGKMIKTAEKKEEAKEEKKMKKMAKGGSVSGGNWIKGAIKHPGAEKKAAAKAGMSTHAYMEKNKSKPGLAGKRARLGLTLSKMSKGK